MHLANVTTDCDDPLAVSAFWAAALDRKVDDDASEYFASIDRHDHSRISMFFIKVPEPKSTKNRMHLDLHADDREAAVERLVSLGATRLDDHDEWGVRWTTLADVEGNEFCIASGNPS
ncbi:MAG: VOC family protein [Acidimicrobiales bacterium]